MSRCHCQIPADRSLKRAARGSALLAGVAAVAGLLASWPARAIDFAAVAGLGIEYKNEVRVNARERLVVGTLRAADYSMLQSTVTLNNNDNLKKNLVVCVSGSSKRFDDTFRRTEIDMTFNAAQKTLECSLSQEQSENNRVRLGQMGCRQVTLAENQKAVVVAFVSGNNRTTIKKVANKLEIDRIGPVQDGIRNAGKIIAAGGAGAGGHPLVSPNNINGNREKMSTAIKTIATRFILSADPAVKLADAADQFNCNKCFGMGSTLGDPPATRTDFRLNPPSDADAIKAMLKIKTVYDSLGDILLSAGAKTQVPIDLANESANPIYATVTPTLVEMPAQCTAQVSLPQLQPLLIPARESVQATLDFDCDASLPTGAAAMVILALKQEGTDDVLSSYNVRARNPQVCDVNADGRVDSDDIELIMSYRNTLASGPHDRFNVDNDGMITVLDARACTLKCTSALCAR